MGRKAIRCIRLTEEGVLLQQGKGKEGKKYVWRLGHAAGVASPPKRNKDPLKERAESVIKIRKRVDQKTSIVWFSFPRKRREWFERWGRAKTPTTCQWKL